MPNHCQNIMKITVRGSESERDALIERILKEKDQVLSVICPLKEGVLGYDGWGTRGVLNPVTVEDVDVKRGTVLLTFNTAWAPPSLAVEGALEQLDIELLYEEYGMSFYGETRRVSGELTLLQADMDHLDFEYTDDEECEDGDARFRSLLTEDARAKGLAKFAEWIDDGGSDLFSF